MPKNPAPGPSWKPTDRDLARLVRRGEREAAGDPAATDLNRRLRDRDNRELDHDHRARSDRSAILGALAGLVLLVVFVVGSLLTSHR
ncbi:hypothetical protein ABZ800_16445 [Streptomyces sp. NPDC047813]|uniref:hypothetical protein n=1 Tax=Streptomyces sp. NPDC047813 TaxID=3154608 RepID=UPI0033E856A5